MIRPFIPLAAALACGATPACAAEDAHGTDYASGEPIVVTGAQLPYGVSATDTATRTPTNIKDIPQALTTVSRAQIDDQQLRSVGDLLLFVPGASYGSGEGNRDQLVLRGNSSTADFFVDGIRNDVQYVRDFYNVERVEVLKGPNAMIFGRGGGGGIVNRVLKRPRFTAATSAAASADNEGTRRFTADVNRPLSDRVWLRLNGVIEDSDTFRHHDRLRRSGLDTSLALLAGSGTRVDLAFEHFHDRRTADRGVPALGGEPMRGFDRTFFGDPAISFARANVDAARVALEHRLGSALTLRNRTQLANYRKFYQNVFASSFNPATGFVALAGYNNLNNRHALFSQTDLIWDSRMGSLEQTLLLGFELGSERSRNRHLTATLLSPAAVPVSAPTVATRTLFSPLPSDADNRARASTASVYVQDQIRPARWLEIIVGLRVERVAIKVDDRRPVGGLFGRTDRLWSPRAGIVLKPSETSSIYASYSRSFLPQSGDQFSSLTQVTEELKPERFDNREVGIKLQLPRGLLATAALYRLDRSRTRATDPSNSALTVLTGAQRSTGLELGLERSIANNWLISAGYAFQRARIISTTTSAPAGRQVPLVPRHSLSLWTRFNLASDIGAGLGAIARSNSFASISNSVKLPGYTRFDAALFYGFRNGLRLQINVENLLGTHYFPTANADNNIIPGAPRTVKATLGYAF